MDALAQGAALEVHPARSGRIEGGGRRGSRTIRLRPSRAEASVLLLAAALAGLMLLWLRLTPDRGEALLDGPAWIFPLIALLFGVAEYAVFNVHLRRQPISFTLAEIPIAVALVFLTPGAGLIARVPVALFVFALLRRNSPVKLVFNLSLTLFEMSLAMLLLRVALDSATDSSTGLLLAIVASLVVVMLVSAVLIALAISMFDGGFLRHLAVETRSTWWLYPINTVLAAMIVSLMLIEPWLVLLAVCPIVGIWYIVNSYGTLSQELRDLDLVHGFTGRIGRSLDVDEIGDAAVKEMTSSFRAQGAALIRFDTSPAEIHRYGEVPIALPETDDCDKWGRLLVDGPRVVTAVELRRCAIPFEDGLPAILLSPIADENGTLALAVLCQAESYGHTFGRGELARLENMTQQLGVSLRRGLLHERLEYEARHDALTDLPSRLLFERSVEAAIGGGDQLWAVLMIDLDRFKDVNDTLGHHAGDALLIEFGRRIAALLGPDDQLARLAGDEFAVLLRRPDCDAVIELAEEIARTSGQPVTLDGIEIVVTASVGVAELDAHDKNAVAPMRRADIAMYNAKWRRTGVEHYRDEIDRRTPARLSMLGDLRAAIEEGALDVVYQPKFDLEHGTIEGVEALVRWVHETRGDVPPTEFVRIAEDTGLIKDLTDLVLSRGITALRRFEAEGLGLAVNVSTHDLFDSRLPVRVRSYLELNGVDPSLLTLEITESSLLVDVPRTRSTLDELHRVGIRLAIDDFGTGYSSLNYLRRLPVQELKIDQSFVTGMGHDPQDEVIVRSTVDLGHNLGLRVVAEGVESRLVFDRLQAIGCDVAQGFGIAEAMSADEVIAWVHSARSESGRMTLLRALR